MGAILIVEDDPRSATLLRVFCEIGKSKMAKA
jgi:hypothetical protein